MIKVCLIAALAASASLAQAADLYKWTDDKGVVHYSDTAPPNQNTASRVRVQSGVSNEAAPTMKSATGPGADKPADAQSASATPAAPPDRATQCKQARDTLSLLQSPYPVADSSGKPVDDKRRAEMTVQAQQAVADCQKNG